MQVEKFFWRFHENHIETLSCCLSISFSSLILTLSVSLSYSLYLSLSNPLSASLLSIYILSLSISLISSLPFTLYLSLSLHTVLKSPFYTILMYKQNVLRIKQYKYIYFTISSFNRKFNSNRYRYVAYLIAYALSSFFMHFLRCCLSETTNLFNKAAFNAP